MKKIALHWQILIAIGLAVIAGFAVNRAIAIHAHAMLFSMRNNRPSRSRLRSPKLARRPWLPPKGAVWQLPSPRLVAR